MRKTKLGQELISGLRAALAYERGAKKLRTTELEIAEPARPWKKEQISRLRKEGFGVSQPIFAALLSVTASTVRAWEQGQKSPSGAARRLLEIAAMAPDVVVRASKEIPADTHSLMADRPIAGKHSPWRVKKDA